MVEELLSIPNLPNCYEGLGTYEPFGVVTLLALKGDDEDDSECVVYVDYRGDSATELQCLKVLK